MISSKNLKICRKEQLEAIEHMILSNKASFSSDCMGREYLISPDLDRTEFQRDRDRILHCKSFRRLSHKTQVFLAAEGDHYRTRLTHTLEVSQISRTVARCLCLNEDLTEAIALGHDLGHTPFGHTGEHALQNCLARIKGIPLDSPEAKGLFRHNMQSVRVVRQLEGNGKGLNLTREVIDGIKNHSGDLRAMTLEGRIVAVSDRIAYINHDIDDAIRAGMISEDSLSKKTHEILGKTNSERISTLVDNLIDNSARIGDIHMSDDVWIAMMELREFMFNNVYFNNTSRTEEPKALHVVESLYNHYYEHYSLIPKEYKLKANDAREVQVADFIAGMTDRYAIRDYERLFVPHSWNHSEDLES